MICALSHICTMFCALPHNLHPFIIPVQSTKTIAMRYLEFLGVYLFRNRRIYLFEDVQGSSSPLICNVSQVLDSLYRGFEIHFPSAMPDLI